MFCTNCGAKNSDNSVFCTNCGNRFNNIKSNSKKSYRKLLVAIFLVIIFMATCYVGYAHYNLNGNVDSRTIMIYMSGSTLESDAKIATAEISSIDPSLIDLKSTNILLFTGGTEKWFNFVSSDENAIYKLEQDGFKKIESYATDNMGNPQTFTNFLNYAYENYSADRYDLIIWDHGLGTLGSVQDEINDDFLDILEMKKALSNSHFSENNKMETVIFRTCLNATAEIASVYDDYAHYMVASEEVTLGATGHSVLNFLNDIEVSDNGFNTGNKFINSYKQQIDEITIFSYPDCTYSIINLDKFNEVEKALDDFASSIDINKNFALISRTRKNLHQYAVDSSDSYDFDTVDLYQLVSEIKNVSPDKADKLLNLIKETVEFNWSTNDFSNGISIYFPYNGSDGAQTTHLSLYDKLGFCSSYTKFIEDFNDMKMNNSSNFSINVFSNKIDSSNKLLQLKLDDEQLENYAAARYILFRKTYSEEGFYKYFPLIRSYDVTLSNDGVITANVDNKLVRVVDKSNNDSDYISVIDIKDSKVKKYQITGLLGGTEEDPLALECVNADLEFDENNKPHVTKIVKCAKEFEVDSSLLNLEDWEYFSWLTSGYRILDDDGNYMENWPSNKIVTGWDVFVKDLDFESANLDLDGEDDYYGIFQVFDIYGNYSYSNLIKIN